jgi:PAS domain S-box-containing protein
MDSNRLVEIKKSIETLLAELTNELSIGNESLKEADVDSIIKRIDHLEKAYKQLFSISNSKDSIFELLSIQANLKEREANLIAQIDNTNDGIWSVDSKLRIKTVNRSFYNNFKTAFGVELKEGVDVLVSLPEPLKSVWKERYLKAFNGEQFSVVDHFEIEDVPQYTETSFNPIKINGEIVGISCFSRDISKQKESEEQFKLLAKMSPNPISIFSFEKYLYVNKAWENLMGFTKEEAYSSGIQLILAKENKDLVLNEIKNFIKSSTENTRTTYQIITKSKESIWVDVALTHIKFNNQKAILSISTDVSELLQLHEELKRIQANLLSQLDNTDARIWSIDTKMDIVNTNSNFRNDYKLAFNIDLVEGMSALEGVPVALLETWTERYKNALAGEKFTFVEEFHIKNIPQFVEVSFNPITIEGKVVGVSCYSRDISRQRNADIALKESEKRYKTLVESIPNTTYRCVMDKQCTIEFISDEIESLTGYPAVDFIGNAVRTYNSLIHPEDKDIVGKTIQEGVKRKESYRIEYRIVHKNGTVKWVHERGRVIYPDKGAIGSLIGVIADITLRKQSEEALRESEEQYRAIFNSISDVFLRTDLSGNILIATPSINDIFGYTPEEITGKSINKLYKDPDEGKKLLAQLYEKGFVRDYELVFLSHSGREVITSSNAKLLVNEDGIPYGIDEIARDITYTKIAQKALEERTRELDSIFENTPIILLLIDSKCRVLNVNKAGINDSKHNKSKLTSLLAGEAIRCVNSIRTKENCGKGELCNNCVVVNTIQKTFKTKQNQDQVEGSLVILVDNKEVERHFLISTTFIEFEETYRILISLDDITEIREAQEEIRRLSAAVEQSTATVVITDIHGNIEYVNPQFEKTTGYSPSEVLGKNPRILKSDNTLSESYAILWETITSGKTWHGEFLNVRKDRTTYWESAIISPITNRKGEVTHFLAIKENITERKRIQEELVRSEQELREINEEKSRYLAILAHDLRGLVGGFHAYSDLINTHFDEFSSEDLKEQIANLTKVSGDSLNLLDNLLEWGKVTQGQITIDLKEIDIAAETDCVFKILNEIAANKKILLINNLPKKTVITSDVNIFQTIIRNLVNNAVKFTPVNGSITVDAKKISDDFIEISVSDTGVGMEEEIMNKLFKLGEKVISEGTENEKGTGLGLIICREMVKKLGGTISVESQPGHGSRFYFRLPL